MKNIIFTNTSNLTILNETTSTQQIPSKALLPYDTSDWGPKRDSLYIIIPITLLYIIIFITGLLGNICTCIVITRNKSMHTATNYYLFSLAISDLLLLVSGLPTEIYSTWYKYPYIFGELFCILQGFAAETSANATVLTITAFTIERYIAICHPFLSHTMSKLSRAIKFVILIWLLAMCLALPQAMSFGIFHEQLLDGRLANNDHYVCTVKRIVIPHAFEISTILFFIAPMSVITILYILIGLQIHKSTNRNTRDGSVKLKHRDAKQFHNTPENQMTNLDEKNTDKIEFDYKEEGRKNYPRNSQSAKHVVKMLVLIYTHVSLKRIVVSNANFLIVAVVVAFFICWAPFHAQRLLAIYAQPDSSNMITTFTILTYISGILYYLSTTVNPVLYHIMSHKFRVAFKETITCIVRSNRTAAGKKCYSALSARSSQVNSHSNTDSCSQQSSIRYLETEMRRLRESRRPLVVSFRRKQQPVHKIKQVTVFDAELQKALDNLSENKENRYTRKSRQVNKKSESLDDRNLSENLQQKYRFLELQNLESSSQCSINITRAKWENCERNETEMFGRKILPFSNLNFSFKKSQTLPNINYHIKGDPCYRSE